MFNLDALISPFNTDTFINQIHGKKAVYIKGTPEKFPDLFGWNDVEKILNHSRPSLEGVHLIYEKNGLPMHEIKQIDQWLQKGATLLINFVNQIHERVDTLASELGNDLNTIVTVNCYVSCPAKQGFDIHFDKHDVFIIQTKGRKKWFVYEPTTVKSPIERQQMPKQDLPKGDPYLECELNEGDVLYIPRGHWHYAVALTPSIHLSVGPEARTGVDLLLWLARQLMDQDEFFRRDFPVIQTRALGGHREESALEKHLEIFRQRMHQLLDQKEIMGSLVRFYMQSNPVGRSYQMPGMWEFKERISPAVRLAFSPVQKVLFHYDQKNGTAVVQARGNSFMFMGPETLFLNLFNSGQDTFSGQDVLNACPDIHWDQLKALLIQMYEKGLILESLEAPVFSPASETLK